MPIVSASKYLVNAGSHWHRHERQKTCAMCGNSKPVSDFYAYGYVTRQGKDSTRYESRCKPCARKRRRDAHAANPEMGAQISKRWRENNPDKRVAYSQQYQASEHGRRMKAKAQRLRKARLRSGQPDCPEVRAIYDEAMRIEKIVARCPVFALPELGYKMHVDHIRPLARGGQHVASNLQILPIGLNMRKGSKCPS